MCVLYLTIQHINRENRHIHLIYKPISKVFRRGMTSLKNQNLSLLFGQYQQFNRENGNTNIQTISEPKIICFELYISTNQQGKINIYTSSINLYQNSLVGEEWLLWQCRTWALYYLQINNSTGKKDTPIKKNSEVSKKSYLIIKFNRSTGKIDIYFSPLNLYLG